MKILSLLTACLLLAACVTIPSATRPGLGVVESVVRTPGDSPDMAYRTGGSYPAGYLIRVRMEDGSVQLVTQNSGAFRAGDRVEITREGKVLTSQ